MFTKFKHWEYEKEIRIWGTLGKPEKGIHFAPFDPKTLRLVEVIKGAESTVPTAEIVNALGSLAKRVKISKARAAYDRFEMVEEQDSPILAATTKSTGRINVKKRRWQWLQLVPLEP